jgi:hypothetical protein
MSNGLADTMPGLLLYEILWQRSPHYKRSNGYISHLLWVAYQFSSCRPVRWCTVILKMVVQFGFRETEPVLLPISHDYSPMQVRLRKPAYSNRNTP